MISVRDCIKIRVWDWRAVGKEKRKVAGMSRRARRHLSFDETAPDCSATIEQCVPVKRKTNVQLSEHRRKVAERKLKKEKQQRRSKPKQKGGKR